MKNSLTILLSVLLFQTAFATEGLPDEAYLKVCADPYMLPFSNQKGEGYENKISELFAKKLGLKLKYQFFPQRIGFIRNTLKAESEEGLGYKCDLVMSVPSNFELAATTEPYFASSYALVYAKGRKLDSITEPTMLDKFVNEQGHDEIKIGLPDRGPQQLWVFYNNLMANIEVYQGQPGNPKVNPGQTLIEDIIAGKIDAAIVWGPTAGYFAKQSQDKVKLAILPLKDDPKKQNMRFTYSFSMAVRHSDKAWKDKINNLIKENQAEIKKILTDYNIPLIKH